MPDAAPVESVAVLPSGKPADDAVKPSPPPAKKSPSLGALIAASPDKLDNFLSHLFRCMQTRAGADAVLMFACYSTRLAGSLLEIASAATLKASSRQLIESLFKLPPATTVVMASTTTPTSVATMMSLAAKLKAYSAMISEMRCMGRLWGLLGLYFAAKRLVVKSLSKSKADPEKASTESAAEATFDTVVAYTQIISLIIFQAAENASYLTGRKVLPFSPATQGKLALLSVRSWALYVFIEFSRLLIERSRKQSSGVAVKDAEWSAQWKKTFLRNASWAPLTLHWGSTTGGFLPDVLVSFFGAYPATSQLIDLWKANA
ncbi:hypothetical protein VHEMI02775 [[Torrubiella] hemipterigena]|uniref:Peroxin 11C n=1 Tax=[Torrubiella] hemipterigena TaxID=1531966 RepID=A0A0A1SWR8_9HYPO|nr:hypothetical protein VHEMI02775 [[Torrubiella] hemipterigena]